MNWELRMEFVLNTWIIKIRILPTEFMDVDELVENTDKLLESLEENRAKW